jgi:hypothetical protein
MLLNGQLVVLVSVVAMVVGGGVLEMIDTEAFTVLMD